MATMGSYVTKEITSKVDLFGSIMQENVIENEFNRKYAPLGTIQQGAPIEFTVKGANDLYLELNNSRLHVLSKIAKADGTNINVDRRFNQPNASLDVPQDCRKVERSKCGRHEPAIPVPRIPADSAQLLFRKPNRNVFFAIAGPRTLPGKWCQRSRRS